MYLTKSLLSYNLYLSSKSPFLLSELLIRQMNESEDNLRTEILEAILEYLEYLEDKRTFRSVLTLGITANSKIRALKNPNLASVVSQLNSLGNQIANGHNFSKVERKDMFTTMLEKLIK